MNPIRLYYHVNCQPEAYIERFLSLRNVPYEVVCLDDDTEVPTDIDQLAGIVLLGGAGNVNQPTSWMIKELVLIKQIAEKGIPLMGVCLGAQIICKALGGEVYAYENLEIGWHQVTQHLLDQDNEGRYWFSDLPENFEVFQWHAHTCTLPPGATALATSPCCELQAFSLPNILAMQFHLEMTDELIEHLILNFSEDIARSSDCVQNAEMLREKLAEHTHQLHQTADLVYERWLQSISKK